MVLYRRFRYAIPVGLVALLLGMVFMGNSSTPTDQTSRVNLSDIQEDVVRELYDSSGKMINPDRQMQDIAKAGDGGFGGYYFDPNDPSTVYIYMTDMTKAAAAEVAFRAAQPRMRSTQTSWSSRAGTPWTAWSTGSMQLSQHLTREAWT